MFHSAGHPFRGTNIDFLGNFHPILSGYSTQFRRNRFNIALEYSKFIACGFKGFIESEIQNLGCHRSCLCIFYDGGSFTRPCNSIDFYIARRIDYIVLFVCKLHGLENFRQSYNFP